MVNPGWTWIAVAGLGLAACELTEVTRPVAESTLVVHGVLNARAAQQFVLVANSWTGRGEQETFVFGGTIPAVPVPLPVSGALVRLTHLTPPADCADPVVTLSEAPPFSQFGEEAFPRGAYTTTDLCALRATDRLRLEVMAPDGRRVSGETTIPGIRTASLVSGTATGDTLPLVRPRDTLAITVDPVAARGLEVEILRADQVNLPPEFGFPVPPVGFLTDTMGVRIAGNAIQPLEGSDGLPVFEAGRFYTVTVAVTDTNYYDFTRSGADVFTGRGFINHLDGGIGVFGSVAPITRAVRVTQPPADPREGVYQVRGTVAGDTVDVRLELYLLAARSNHGIPGAFAALFEGTWRGRPIAGSVEGAFGDNPNHPFGPAPFSFQFDAVDGGDALVRYSFAGGDPTGAVPRAELVVRAGFESEPVGQVTIERSP